MTADEFATAYAERSGLTVDELKELGLVARECDCGDELCDGWQMVASFTLPAARVAVDPSGIARIPLVPLTQLPRKS